MAVLIIALVSLAVLTALALFVIFISGGDPTYYLDGVDLDPDN
jgi:hypothetical protein